VRIWMRRIALRSTLIISEFGSRGEQWRVGDRKEKPSPFAKSVSEGFCLRQLTPPSSGKPTGSPEAGFDGGPSAPWGSRAGMFISYKTATYGLNCALARRPRRPRSALPVQRVWTRCERSASRRVRPIEPDSQIDTASQRGVDESGHGRAASPKIPASGREPILPQQLLEGALRIDFVHLVRSKK